MVADESCGSIIDIASGGDSQLEAALDLFDHEPGLTSRRRAYHAPIIEVPGIALRGQVVPDLAAHLACQHEGEAGLAREQHPQALDAVIVLVVDDHIGIAPPDPGGLRLDA